MGVFFIKLSTGDEIIGTIHRHGQSIMVDDPMIMGESETDGQKFIFMMRYGQFSRDHQFWLDRKNVVHMTPVMSEVETYYKSSLDYCSRVADAEFKSLMKQASLMNDKVTEEKTAESPEPLNLSTTLH